MPTIVSDTTAVGIATINPFRYRGYYYDAETQLYYLQSRYYNPTIGRFINADEPEVVVLSNVSNMINQYTYCDNNPTFDADYGGYISFSGIKQAIKNIADNIKKFISNLVDYVKKQFQTFIGKVSCHFNNGYLRIPTAPFGYLIDAVITTISGLIRGAILKGGFTLIKLWFKSNTPALKTFIKNTVVPILKNTDALLNSFLQYVASRFKRKCAWVITKSKIEDRILGNYDLYKWLSAISSIGSFIATFLDILDGKWDDYLSI